MVRFVGPVAALSAFVALASGAHGEGTSATQSASLGTVQFCSSSPILVHPCPSGQMQVVLHEAEVKDNVVQCINRRFFCVPGGTFFPAVLVDNPKY